MAIAAHATLLHGTDWTLDRRGTGALPCGGPLCTRGTHSETVIGELFIWPEFDELAISSTFSHCFFREIRFPVMAPAARYGRV